MDKASSERDRRRWELLDTSQLAKLLNLWKSWCWFSYWGGATTAGVSKQRTESTPINGTCSSTREIGDWKLHSQDGAWYKLRIAYSTCGRSIHCGTSYGLLQRKRRIVLESWYDFGQWSHQPQGPPQGKGPAPWRRRSPGRTLRSLMQTYDIIWLWGNINHQY